MGRIKPNHQSLPHIHKSMPSTQMIWWKNVADLFMRTGHSCSSIHPSIHLYIYIAYIHIYIHLSICLHTCVNIRIYIFIYLLIYLFKYCLFSMVLTPGASRAPWHDQSWRPGPPRSCSMSRPSGLIPWWKLG